MNIQYCHIRKFIPQFNLSNFTYESLLSAKGGETVAMQEVQPWLINELKVGDFFTKSVGRSRCSDKENYNKKTGREVAKSRMKPTVLTVILIKEFSGIKTVILSDDKKNTYILQKNPNFEKVHFIGQE